MSISSERAAETLQAILACIPTPDLISELSTREGVACYDIADGEHYLIQKSTVEDQHSHKKILETYEGPSKIITVVE